MTTTNQSVLKTPRGSAQTQVVAKATFSAEGDYTDWVSFSGDVTLQAQGPVDAATLAIERSTVDPSGGYPDTVEVDDGTGSGGSGVTFTVTGAGDAWYRAKNKATFGPANTVVARTLASLAAAINGLQPSANGFAAGTAPQPLVHATIPTTTTMLLTAATAGVAGNDIDTTETLANGAFGSATLIGGLDAVAASGTLTFSALPTAAMTVTIGATVYTYVAALGSGLYEVLRGSTLTTARDNLKNAINLTGAQAIGVLTANTNPAAGATVRLGNYTYTFVASLTAAPSPFQVKTQASASLALDALIAAINGAAGGGTTYNVNTPPNPLATAAAGTGDTVDVTSVGFGADANLIRTAGAAADVKATGTLTFTPGTVTTQTIQLGGVYYIFAADPLSDAAADGSVGHPYQVDVGVTATISLANLKAAINASGVRGTTYSYTLAPANANASAEATASDATTVSVRAIAAGAGGNSISSTVPSGSGFAWGATTLAGGATSLTWAAAQLSGATGPGVTYGSDIVINPDVTAASVSTNAMTATAKTAGVAGNSIATTDTLTDVKATGTLTFTPGTITTQTVKLGASYYIWAADPTTDAAADGTVTHPWQVLVGTATASLANLRKAINATGIAGTDYSTALTVNASATATASTATTLTAEALTAGAAGNSISTTVPAGAGLAWGATTLTGGGGSWGAATLASGAAAVAATVTLTMSGAFANTNTVTIEGVVYTVKTALTPTAGEVMIAGTTIDLTLSGVEARNV